MIERCSVSISTLLFSKSTNFYFTDFTLRGGMSRKHLTKFGLLSRPASIRCNWVWHESDERLPFESLTEELLSLLELKLKSASLPLTIIHQPRFALTLLLCKCPYHISCTVWGKRSGIKLGEGETGAVTRPQAGSVILTNLCECDNCHALLVKLILLCWNNKTEYKSI